VENLPSRRTMDRPESALVLIAVHVAGRALVLGMVVPTASSNSNVLPHTGGPATGEAGQGSSGSACTLAMLSIHGKVIAACGSASGRVQRS
jgi:hypothetical protein